VQRVRELGQDDHLAWALIPLLGASIAASMLMAIIYGLTSDEKWDLRFNAGRDGTHTGWGPILGVVGALLVGTGVLMADHRRSAASASSSTAREARKISQ
jgi:hypothetical protein